MDLLVSAALATLIGAVCLAITTGDVLPRPPPVSVTRPAGIATTITARTPSPPARGGLTLALTWPLSPRPTVGRRFEQPHTQCSSGHRGVDLSASVSQAVLSAGEWRRGILRHGRGGGDHCSASERTAHQLRTGRVRMSAGARVRRGTRIAVVSDNRWALRATHLSSLGSHLGKDLPGPSGPARHRHADPAPARSSSHRTVQARGCAC